MLGTTAQTAAADQWSYTGFLSHLLDAEIRARHKRTVKLSRQFAKLPVIKRLVDELATLRFVDESRVIVNQWLDEYNHIRPHGSLQCQSPEQFLRHYNTVN